MYTWFSSTTFALLSVLSIAQVCFTSLDKMAKLKRKEVRMWNFLFNLSVCCAFYGIWGFICQSNSDNSVILYHGTSPKRDRKYTLLKTLTFVRWKRWHMAMLITTERTESIYGFSCFLWHAGFLRSAQPFMQAWALSVEVWDMNQECARCGLWGIYLLLKGLVFMQPRYW